ncbi:hypothetical protein DI09_131p90, partial [Mitosporidium daphniae]
FFLGNAFRKEDILKLKDAVKKSVFVSIAFSGDNKLILAGAQTTTKQTEFQIWDCASGMHLKTIDEGKLDVRHFAFHCCLPLFGSISNNSVLIWGPKTAFQVETERACLPTLSNAPEKSRVSSDENHSTEHNTQESSVKHEKEINENFSIRSLSKSHPAAYAMAKFLDGWPKKKRLAFSTAGFYLLDENIIYEEREDEFDEPIQASTGFVQESAPSHLDENLKTYLGLNAKSWPDIKREFQIVNMPIEGNTVFSMAQMSQIKLQGYLSSDHVEIEGEK